MVLAYNILCCLTCSRSLLNSSWPHIISLPISALSSGIVNKYTVLQTNTTSWVDWVEYHSLSHRPALPETFHWLIVGGSLGFVGKHCWRCIFISLVCSLAIRFSKRRARICSSTIPCSLLFGSTLYFITKFRKNYYLFLCNSTQYNVGTLSVPRYIGNTYFEHWQMVQHLKLNTMMQFNDMPVRCRFNKTRGTDDYQADQCWVVQGVRLFIPFFNPACNKI